ncbi:MAG TPA: MBL fold metallo-hydrolase [Alphaproteobacteria bacterium]|jgi:metallo-beta-lactamase family protein|nr:MBL fold metallo-hydrolase [Alphaproteobacteria bacterium]
MKIKFLGAAGTVTGSSYVLTSSSGQSILIDLGMFQGPPEINNLNYEPFDYDPSLLSAAILTHAHLDHCGRLPIIMPRGFRASIWMTPATRDLTELSLFDSAKIARDDGKQALYDSATVTQTIVNFRPVDYHLPTQIGDFTVTFRDAGHILGSASLEITEKNPNSEIKKIVFSGDLGNTPEPLEAATEAVDSADAVVMESTYGDRLHPIGNPIDVIQNEINTIEKTGGTLLIPSFSLDRSQELMHIIMHLKKEGRVALQTPVFLDSPMAQKATTIYVNYPKLFNPHIQEDLKLGDIFDFPGLSLATPSPIGPKVIIAGSGMMTGGRIVGHAAHYLPMISTRLLIVGYQGEGTLGRELLEGKREVFIEGKSIKVQGTITDIQTMSSHADQKQLMTWLKHIKNVKKVFLTHGEDGPRTVLSQKISEELGIKDITLPVLNQEIEI